MPKLIFLTTEDIERLTTEDGEYLVLEYAQQTVYSSCALVAQMIPNLLNNASDFDSIASNIAPGEFQLYRFMESGYSKINSHLKNRGWQHGIHSSCALHDVCADTEAAYVAMRAEMVRASPRVDENERSRIEQFEKQFDDGLEEILALDLTEWGMPYTKEYFYGSQTIGEVADVEDDTDRVKSRFRRGMFNGI